MRKCITYPIPGKIHAEKQVLAGCVCVGGGGVRSQPKNWTNSCRGGGVGVHPLNLDQFSKTHAFFTRYWIVSVPGHCLFIYFP